MPSSDRSKPYDRNLPRWAANTTSLPIRISIHDDIARQVSEQLLGTWKRAGFRTESIHGEEYLGFAGLEHAISLLFPGAPPARIPILVELFDFSCVLDNIQDTQGQSIAAVSRKAKCQLTKVACRVLLKAPLSAAACLKPVITYLRSLRSFSSVLPAEHPAFALVFPIRLYDFPCSLFLPSLAFALDLKLSAEEAAALQRVSVFAAAAMVVGNDILSWPNEVLEREASKVEPCSSVTILMRQSGGCTEGEALLACRHKLMQFEAEATRLSEELVRNPNTTTNVKTMADACVQMIAGFAAWQCTSHKYLRQGPAAELVREVLEMPLPPVELNKAFEEECELIFTGYLAIHKKYFK